MLLLRQFFVVALDELEGVRHIRVVTHLSVFCLQVTEKDVFFYRCIEKYRLLHDVADLSAKLRNIVLTDILAIDEDVALLNVIEP